MKKNSSIRFFYALVFVVPVLAYSVLDWYKRKMEKLPVLGPFKTMHGKKIEHHVDDFHMINQYGRPVTTDNWAGKIVIVDFFFTHCPSICPKMTKNLVQLKTKLNGAKDILFNSFTVDPERDSAAQLKHYMVQRGADKGDWDFLTGEKKAIYKLARNSFMIVATDGDGGPTDFIHSDKIVLVDRAKRIRGYYDGTSDKEMNQLLEDIKKLRYEY